MRKQTTSETTLKKSKPMIMSDEDFKYYNAMLTDRKKKFKNSRKACSTIIEGAYMSDAHIDFFNGKNGIATINGKDVKSVDYPVYNARSCDLYDVFLRVVENPDGTVAVRLVRPPKSNFDKEKELRSSSNFMKMMAL